MTFEIDTGATVTFTAIGLIPDWARDQCPDDYADWQIVQSYAHHIMGDMRRPAKNETVRNHLLFNWMFLKLLATESPGLFDEVWTAYSERLQGGAD